MEKNKFCFLLTLTICLVLVACSKDDDNSASDDPLSEISVTELESQPSFVSNHSTYTTYVWFRNGRMRVWKKGSTNANSSNLYYTYSINGKKLTITTIEHLGKEATTYQGYITKFTSNSKKQLVISQGLDGTNLGNLPDDVLNWYDYSTINLDM